MFGVEVAIYYSYYSIAALEVYLVKIFGGSSGMTGMPPTRVLVVFPVGEGKMVVFPETDALIPGDGKMVITYLGSSNGC